MWVLECPLSESETVRASEHLETRPRPTHDVVRRHIPVTGQILLLVDRRPVWNGDENVSVDGQKARERFKQVMHVADVLESLKKADDGEGIWALVRKFGHRTAPSREARPSQPLHGSRVVVHCGRVEERSEGRRPQTLEERAVSGPNLEEVKRAARS
jgi:hypothetical protein